MRKNILIIIFMFGFIIPGYKGSLMLSQDSGSDPGMDYIEEIGDVAFMNWTTKTLRVKGYGFGPENVKQLGRRKILAKRAAKVDAQRNLLEVVKGVRVTSHTTVQDMMLESDNIKTKTQGMVKGFRVVEVIYTNDGGCEVTVEVNIDKDGAFLTAALQNGEIKVIDNYPKYDWAAMQRELEEVRIALASAKRELEKTKSVVHNLTYKLAHQGMTHKGNEPSGVFLLQKKKELEQLSSEIAIYDGPEVTSLNLETVEGYKQRIKEIQRETGTHKKPGPEHKTKAGTSGRKRFADEPVKPMPAGMPATSVIKANYTGLLVDARELDFKPAKYPSLLNQKKEKVYGIGVIPATVTTDTIVDYSVGNVEYAKKNEKICSQPLVVKGIELEKDSDIIISDEEARKLVLIMQHLEQGKVVILIKGQ